MILIYENVAKKIHIICYKNGIFMAFFIWL
nr:MAG TPA: hypothetical protein [Caudoviricetes sp.]